MTPPGKEIILSLIGVMLFGSIPVAHGNEEHKQITGPFTSPMEVTKKCLECHDEAGHDVMRTSHWTWSVEQEIPGQGKVVRGKKNVINNFCISINENWPRCTSCHISYGWKDASFDLSDQTKIDCLVCHDTTGKYIKPGPGAGMPAGFTGNPKLDKKKVDLLLIAQNVGTPERVNCLTCHGYGGGGDNVKHGDIDSMIQLADSSYDFHMGSDGLNFNCQECHTTKEHNIKGNAMVVSPGSKNHISCTDCHNSAPHELAKLNDHGASVACQTCHIPFFAKGMPTKLEWDWSTAGQDKKGKKDKYGKPTYVKKKGTFVWGQNVVPTYAWYNGNAGAYTSGDKIDPTKVTKLNWPEGNIKDKNAKIYPFKVHKGQQIYDKKHQYFISPKLWPGGDNAEAAYWKSFDWDKAAKAGMKNSGLKYSGEYGFAPTIMFWRLNHMVAPSGAALDCMDCHGKIGRLDWKALGYKADPMKVKGAARMVH